MRDPKNLQQVDYSGEDSITIVMDEIPEYNLIDFDLQDEKQFKKYIDSIERDVRGSFEYKAYINYLRELFFI